MFSAIERLEGMITQAATAAEEQTQVAEEINENVQSVSQLSGDTLNVIREADASVDTLAVGFGEVRDRLNAFKT